VNTATFTGNVAARNSWVGMSISNAGSFFPSPNFGVVVAADNDLCTGHSSQGALQLELNDGARNKHINTWNGKAVLGKQIPMTYKVRVCCVWL